MTDQPSERILALIDQLASSPLSYRERAERDLDKITDGNRVWWQHVATAGVWALLAIAHAIERKSS